MALVTMTSYLDFDNLAATYGYALVYAGLKANCFVKREESDFTFEQVCDWVDAMSLEELTKVRDCFEETQAFKSMLPKDDEPMTKKKPKSKEQKD
jgi:hypothetical protein